MGNDDTAVATFADAKPDVPLDADDVSGGEVVKSIGERTQPVVFQILGEFGGGDQILLCCAIQC